jgi:hypothetical protein
MNCCGQVDNSAPQLRSATSGRIVISSKQSQIEYSLLTNPGSSTVDGIEQSVRQHLPRYNEGRRLQALVSVLSPRE